MTNGWTVERARHEAIVSAGAGFTFLLAFGVTWIAAAAVSFAVPTEVAAWVYLLQAFVGMPAAFGLQRALGYPRASPDNPLGPLAVQLVFIQPVAFPAFLLMLEIEPAFVPVAFAAVLGAHFLPFAWIHRTPVYVVLGIVVSAGAYGLAITLGARSLHYTGFFVGACLLIAAVRVRAHAAAVMNAASSGALPAERGAAAPIAG